MRASDLSYPLRTLLRTTNHERRLKPNMQAQAPDEGPSDIGISASQTAGQPVVEDSTAAGRYDPKFLRTIALKRNIDSTKSLVEAYNAATDNSERAVLLGWLLEYDEQSEDCLKPRAVLEYSELTKIAPRSVHDKGLLRSLVRTLCSCVRQGEYLKPDFAVALHRALVHVDPFLCGGVAELVFVAKKLLSSLSPEPKLSAENCADREATFLALHQALYLVHEANRIGIREEEKKELRRSIAEKQKEIDPLNECYPVKFHFEVLRQALERLKLKDPSSQVTQAMWCGLCGFLHVFHCFRNLLSLDIDPAAITNAFSRLRRETVAFGVSRRPWFDVLRTLMAARLESSKDETKLPLFVSEYDAAMESQRTTMKGDDLKALRFGILQETRQLASQTSSEIVRREAAKKLLTLTASRAIFEEWFDDADIFTAFLDALHEIHTASGDNRETAEAFWQMQRSCEGRAGSTFRVWLSDDAMEHKLEMRHQQHACPERKSIFVKIARTVGYVPLDTLRSNVKDLKERYKHDSFAKVPSLLGTKVGHHVKEMEHYVVAYEEIVEETTIDKREDRKEEGKVKHSSSRKKDHPWDHYEQKKKVTTPVPLEELFKPRCLKPGDPESEVRRVLLYGNPGSGKTCISKVLAHKWAIGEIMREFEVIYVVPIRRVNVAKSKSSQGITLKGVIAQVCFGERDDVEYSDLLTQVEGDLNSPTTLLMFDGLDEAGDDARELVRAAEDRLCKLLILTRPYNLQQIRASVDCQFECRGFNDQQLRNYVHRELEQDEASRLIRSLEQDRGMWETAHTPVTAHILCSLSREHGTAVEDRGKRASMFQIYRNMTNFVWKRFKEMFKERPEAITANKNFVFEDLEKIAFVAFWSGQILIEESIVENNATSTNTTALFKESGFLLLVMEGQQYQFPHLTFQEYFAGKFIARSLQNKGSNQEKRVRNFIREGKYSQKNALTLSFAMHALAQERSKSALKEMLSVVDEDPIEVLGIQHFFLKMRVLEATLEETDEKDMEDFLNDERAIKLAAGARQLLERTLDDDLIRKIVVEEFRQFSCVLRGFPQVLDETIEKVKKTLQISNELKWKAMKTVTDVLKLARQSPKQSCMIIQFALQLAKQPGESCNKKERIRRLCAIAEQIPEHAGEVLPELANACVDENGNVRRAAMHAITSVVAKAPQHAGEVLPWLANRCVDEDWTVRRAAMEAIGSVVAAAPQNAGKVLRALADGCVDEDWTVRRAARKAFESVVAAAPQHAGEVLPALAKGCVDEDGDVRRAAMEAIGSVVAAAPQHAGEVLPALAKGCVDEDRDVRLETMHAIGSVIAAAPQHAGEVLPALANACVDEDRDVRLETMHAIGSVIAAAPQHAGEVLPALANACVDENGNVRRAARKAFESVVAAAPQHAGEVLPALANACVDEDRDVRRAARKAFESVVAAAPQHAGEVLPALANACVDEDGNVGRAAMEAIGSVVAAATQHAGEVLPALANACVDEDGNVRLETMYAIGSVVAAAPQHAGKVLPWLANGCVDEDWTVRRAAMEAIGSVVAAAPQHAGEVLPELADGCVDENGNVRLETMYAIRSVVAAAPQNAGKVLRALADGCVDEDWTVRRAAMEAIGSVVAAAPQHAGEVLPELADGCVDENGNVRRAAMEAIGSVVAAAPQHAGEVLPALANGCVDEDGDVRRAARKAFESVVAAAPQHAGEVLPALANGCVDENGNVRLETMYAIRSVVSAAPQHAGEVLPALANGCVDENGNVRLETMYAIRSVVAAAPQHAGEVLPALANGCVDENGNVRLETMYAIRSVVAAAPQHAGEVLPWLANGCVDEDWTVRLAAMEAIGSVVAAAPQHAGEVLPWLANACVDDDRDVRRTAGKAFESVVAAAPQHAGEVLPALANACVDDDRDVRRAAMEAIGSVVAAAPQHAGKVLPWLANGCVDEDEDVRDAARTSLSNSIDPEKLVVSAMSILSVCKEGLSFFFIQHTFTLEPHAQRRTVNFVFHTTLSRAVGGWCKDNVNSFVSFLKKEFAEKFAGLLEHL